MVVKVNGKLVGETPKEQLDIEKKRFAQKQKARKYREDIKVEELKKRGEGTKKLGEFR